MENNVFMGVEEYFKEKYKEWEGAAQFEGSGERLGRLFDEMCWPSEKIEAEIERHLNSVFEDSYNEMLTTGPTSVWTLCPHHLLPCNFQVWIGYLPDGKVLGLSKFSRVAVTLGKAPTMQEMYSRDLANILWLRLKPLGVGVYIIGRHGCMGCRGIGQEIGVTTSMLKGVFLTEPAVRTEFFNMCRK